MRVIAVVLTLLPSVALAAPSVWVTHATEKIQPGDTPASATSISISAAQNEFEAFQIAVQGGPGGATNVSLAPFTLTGPGGATIDSSHIWMYREALITTQYASNIEVSPGTYPDALIPDVDEVVGEKRNAFPFDVPPDENRVVWVELLVPRDATAGTYSGVVTVQASGFTQDVQVSLTVWPFPLPSTASLRSTFGIMWDGPCQESFAQGYNDPACGDSGLHAMRAQWAAWFLDHRLTVDAVYTGPYASGSGYDWSSWDANYGPLFDGTANTRLPGAKQTTIRYAWTGDQSHHAEWAQHFRSKGWFDKTYDYTCDEPPATCAWSDIPARAAMIHAADPQFRTLVTTNIDQANAHGVLSSIDIMSPVINEMDDKPGMTEAGNQRANYDGYLQGGGELFWYQSCMSEGCAPGTPGGGAKGYDPYFSGWPMIEVDAPAMRNRAMEWLSFVYGIQGELYYFTDQAEASGMDPYSDQWIFGGNGDGTIVYPGRPSQIGGSTPIPVASMRLKLIREGMEDYEYLKLCADLGDPTFAMQQALAVVNDTHTIGSDPNALYAARAALAQRIVQLLNVGTACTDGTAANACSSSQPMACVGGALVPSCASCGCPSGESCQPDGTCGTAAQGDYSIGRVAQPPNIDGQLAEYEGLPTLNLGSSVVQAGWDSTNLYLAFDVADSDLVASTGAEQDIWDADSVEVMIDPTGNGGSSADADDVHVMVDVAGNVGDALAWSDYGFSSHVQVAVDLEGGQVGGSAVGRGYRVELAIPWTSLGITAQDGAQFGFDVAVNQKSLGGALTSTDWRGLTAFNHPSGWGRVTLVSPTVGGTSGTTGSTGTTTGTGTGGSTSTGTSGGGTTGSQAASTSGSSSGGTAGGSTGGPGGTSVTSSGCTSGLGGDGVGALLSVLVGSFFARRRRG